MGPPANMDYISDYTIYTLSDTYPFLSIESVHFNEYHIGDIKNKE